MTDAGRAGTVRGVTFCRSTVTDISVGVPGLAGRDFFRGLSAVVRRRPDFHPRCSAAVATKDGPPPSSTVSQPAGPAGNYRARTGPPPPPTPPKTGPCVEAFADCALNRSPGGRRRPLHHVRMIVTVRRAERACDPAGAAAEVTPARVDGWTSVGGRTVIADPRSVRIHGCSELPASRLRSPGSPCMCMSFAGRAGLETGKNSCGRIDCQNRVAVRFSVIFWVQAR